MAARCSIQSLFIEAIASKIVSFPHQEIYVLHLLIIHFGNKQKKYECPPSKKCHGWPLFLSTSLWLMGQIWRSYFVILPFSLVFVSWWPPSITPYDEITLTIIGLQLWWHSLPGLLGYHSCWYSRVGLIKNISIWCIFFARLHSLSQRYSYYLNFHYRALSEIPNKQTIAGVRIGLINDQFVVNPTTEQMENSELDLMMAGTDSAILMIEVSVKLCLHTCLNASPYSQNFFQMLKQICAYNSCICQHILKSSIFFSGMF